VQSSSFKLRSVVELQGMLGPSGNGDGSQVQLGDGRPSRLSAEICPPRELLQHCRSRPCEEASCQLLVCLVVFDRWWRIIQAISKALTIPALIRRGAQYSTLRLKLTHGNRQRRRVTQLSSRVAEVANQPRRNAITNLIDRQRAAL